MNSRRSTLRSFALLLALTGVLFRGLIPAGFMPSIHAVAGDGVPLVLCSHGQLDSPLDNHSPSDGGSSQSSVEQCPFGAATGPALPGTAAKFVFASPLNDALAEPRIVAQYIGFTHLQPPARGPPLLS